jgi:phosphoglycerol transferase MdoB-like AlkP superfamily enzyme
MLARRLLLVLGVYAVIRVLFLLEHLEQFDGVRPGVIVGAFVQGARFDLSAIVYSNLPFILLSLAPGAVAPGAVHGRAWYQRLLLALFVAVNGALAMIMVADVAYYPFTGTRVTMDVFALAGDASAQAPQLLVNYAGFATLAVALTAALGVFYPRANPGAPSGAPAAARPWHRGALAAIAVLVVAVVAARGGLQKKPLTPIHAFSSGEHEVGVLTLNTAFTLLRSPARRALEPVHFFADDRDAEAILRGPFGYAALAASHRLPQRQNVVLIVLESIGSEFWGVRDRDVQLTPFLDSLAQHGVFYRNTFSNGRRSMDALPSILLGVPLLMGQSVAVSSYQGNEWKGLGDFLGANGYRTSMFHAAVKGTMYFDAMAAMAGIESFYPLEAYPDSLRAREFDGNWGIFDEPSMQWAAAQIGTFQEPFFSLIFTISTHHPYRLPPQYEGVFPEGTMEVHSSVRYLDHAVRRFFESVRDEPWYDNTLFILTGDHTAPQRSTRFDTSIGRFMVPLLLFHPGRKLPPLDATRITQHVDLFPTILDYTGSRPGRVPLFGRSLFGGSPGEAVLQSNEVLWVVRKEAVLQREPNGRERLFALRGEATGEAPAGPAGEAVAPELRRRLDAYVQHYASSMIHNSFYTEPAGRVGARAGRDGGRPVTAAVRRTAP